MCNVYVSSSDSSYASRPLDLSSVLIRSNLQLTFFFIRVNLHNFYLASPWGIALFLLNHTLILVLYYFSVYKYILSSSTSPFDFTMFRLVSISTSALFRLRLAFFHYFPSNAISYNFFILFPEVGQLATSLQHSSPRYVLPSSIHSFFFIRNQLISNQG